MRLLVILLLFLLAGPVQAACAQTTAPAHTTALPDALRQGERLARELTLTTGVAVSPLLGVVLLGAGRYLTAAETDRPALPWHASPRFWGPAAVLLGLVFLKDSSKVALPKLLVVPLDALETLLEKNASGLLALAVLASAFADGDFAGLQALGAQAANFLVPAAWAGAPAAAVAPGALATLFAGCAALVLYTAVWVLAQAGNVLILLSPSSLLDSLLVVAKTTVAVVLLGLAGTLPGQLLALVLVVLAVWLLPRAVRLVVFGTLVSRDLVCHRLLRRPTPAPAADRPLRCFTSCRLGSLPPLTCGRLDVRAGVLAFSWRPLLMGRQRTLHTAIDPAACTLGRGLLSPVVWWQESETTRVQLFRLLPAAAAHLDLVAGRLGLRSAEETSFRSRLVEGWRWCRALFAPAAVVRVMEKEAG
jgi:hypothetical protein